MATVRALRQAATRALHQAPAGAHSSLVCSSTLSSALITPLSSSSSGASVRPFVGAARSHAFAQPKWSADTEGAGDVGFCCGFHRADYLRKQRSAVAGQASMLHSNAGTRTPGFATAPTAAASSTPATFSDPVFSIDASSIRFGRGALDELGAAACSLGLKRVLVVTDRNVARTAFFARALQALRQEGVDAVVYQDTAIEPTSSSIRAATDFAAALSPPVDGFISIGGGSAIDTCKLANLYSTHPPPDNDLLAYVNAPIGRALWPVGEGPSGPQHPRALKPHIACPSTAGTGSETTGIAIFDLEQLGVKSGVAHRALKPSLAIIDPSTQDTVPAAVVAASGFDVLCHALESYTAVPHTQRAGAGAAASTPAQRFRSRPMSQGSNPWADHGCLSALQLLSSALLPAYRSAADSEARDRMMLASTLAGIAFGNVGVHIPHAMSYALSGGVRTFRPQSGYDDVHSGAPRSAEQAALLPHGMSVVLSAPAVFARTAHVSPRRHWEAARALGALPLPASSSSPAAAAGAEADASAVGDALSLHLIHLMRSTDMPSGLQAVGFGPDDVPQLVKGTQAQQRLLNNAPGGRSDAKELDAMFRAAMRYWA